MDPFRALALLLLSFGVHPGNAAERFEKAREMIRADVESGRLPAFAVGVSRKDEILWEEAFGLADGARAIPATVETMFSLASVSKPVTATALMIFVERGAIDLDGPMNDYLGNAPLRARVGRAEDATVRRVADHTAGLPLHHHFFPLSAGERPPAMSETIRRYGNLMTPPGEHFQYSNLGYGVLEHALERASGKDFAAVMEDEVFGPLDMKHAAVVLDPDAETRPMAVRHDERGEPIPFYDFDHRGASAVYASVRDLLRFGMFHVGTARPAEKPVLSTEAIREMQRPKARMQGGRGYGIGWMVDDDRWSERVVEHGGGMPGVSTSLYLVPSKEIVVVALASARSPLPKRVTEAILAELLPPRRGAFFHPDRLSDSAKRRPQPPKRGRRKPPHAFRGVWKGAIATYSGDRPLVLRIDENPGVRARLGEASEAPVMGVTFDRDRVTGLMRGDIGTEEVEDLDYLLRFCLYRDEDTLAGSVAVMATDELRLPMALAHWTQLTKVHPR